MAPWGSVQDFIETWLLAETGGVSRFIQYSRSVKNSIIIVQWKRRPNMLLMGTMVWIIIGVAVVILAVVIGAKIKDRYF